MRKSFFILTVGLLAMGVCSCRRARITPEEVRDTMREDVVFTAATSGYVTKASDAALEDGDSFGIFAMDPLNVLNVKASLSGGKVQPERPVKWELGQSHATRFAALMPYRDGVSGLDCDFSVQTDQRSYQAYSASDLRLSVVDVKPGNPVDFLFQHVLCKLIVNVSGLAAGDEVSAVETGRLQTSLRLNLVDGSMQAGAEQGSVQLGPAVTANGGQGFVAVLVPQSGLLPLMVRLKSGQTVSCVPEAPVTLASGFAYRADIALTPGAGEVSFKLGIADWADGGLMPFKPSNP